MLRSFLIFIILVNAAFASAQDSLFIRVHFIYGSKPKPQFRKTEAKWFGGVLGGHVGIEVDSNKIIDFSYDGKFHYISRKKNRHSKYHIHTVPEFWNTFGNSDGDVKRTTIVIPISRVQKAELDSIVKAYTAQTPYDYAFIGMRCGAASYDILSRIEILKQYSHRRTYLKIFYPKKLRKRLLKKAGQNGWAVYKQEGKSSRRWERD